MKINFKTPYVSITQFNSVEIKDFSILTGKNGSGKTHFLNAIKLGNIEIEGFDKSEIVYYNYNDFTIYTGNLQQNNQFQNRLNVWNNDKQQILQKIQNLKINAIQRVDKERTQIEQIVFKSLQQSNFDFNTYFGNKKDYVLLNTCKESPNILNEIASKQQLFTPQFFEFINEYLNNTTGQVEDLTIEKLEPLFEKQKNSVEDFLKDKNQDLFTFLKTAVKDKSILSLNENDFESPNLFLEDIANEEKDYQFQKTQNILNKIRALEYKDSTTFLESEEFINYNGLSPVEQINNVLSEYDCNGYFLFTNPNQQFLGIDKKSIKVQINLKHKDKGYLTSFDQLSSGEKTLIALSLFIYKTRKKRIVPRVLLLDEIDSSLHPSMIDRLLSVIQNLFVDQQGFKVIMATHSPTTVALANENAIYVVNRNEQTLIEKQTKQKALQILSEGFITLDEGLQILDQVAIKELTIFTEGNNIDFLTRAIELLKPELLNKIEIVSSLKDRTGTGQLSTLYEMFLRMEHKNNVLFIYDCDVTKTFTENDKTKYYIFSKNEINNKVTRGIENLFEENLFEDRFYQQKPKDDGGIHSSLDKQLFLSYILERNNSKDFCNFNELINKIEEIINK
ncbi:MAG: ATP-binding protein [Flavobacteriales bacterium]|nr:ATP-binding protein [Flavobacteriales bacterium]